MSKLFAIASLVAGLTSAATVATAADIQAAPTGYSLNADIWGGYYFLGNSSGNADDNGDQAFGAIGGDATYQTGIGSNYILQLGLQAGYNAVGDGGDDDQSTGGGQASVHVLHSSGLGVFGGAGLTAYESEPTSGLWFAGAEYLYQFGSGDVALQAGFFDTGSEPGQQMRNAWFVNMAPRFVISDTTSVGAHAGVAFGDTQNSGTEVYSWGLSLKHDLGSYPASVFVAYDGMAVDDVEANADEHIVKAGLSFSLGGDANHSIATPEIFRWVGIGQRTD